MKRNALFMIVFVFVLFNICSISTKTMAATSSTTELKSIKNYASKGSVQAAKGIKAGDNASIISKKLGKPSEKYSYREDLIYDYTKSNKIYLSIGIVNVKDHDYDGEYSITKNSKIGYIRSPFKGNKTYTYAQIKKVFGSAKGNYGYNGIDGNLFIFYKIGKFNLYFEQDINQTKHPFEEKLTDKVKFNIYTVNNF